MKKLLAILLALGLVLMSVAALADGDNDIPLPNTGDIALRTAGSPNPVITKTYTTTGGEVYPAETLEFTVTPPTGAPTITIGTNNTYATQGAESYDIPVNVPDASEYGKVGRYHYTITETNPQVNPTQGETYSTTVFNVDVYITYEIVDNKATGNLLKEVVIYSGEEKTENITTKEDTFENTYEVGTLTINKTITGNLADPDLAFTIEVTLNSTNDVNSDITVTQPNEDGTATVDTKVDKGWKGEKKVTVVVKGGQSATISDIPAGVTYKVAETKAGDNASQNITAAQQMDNANVAEAYTVTGEVTTATAISSTGAIVTITNNKAIEVPTGITIDFVPYVMIIALAGIALVALKARKKEN